MRKNPIAHDNVAAFIDKSDNVGAAK